MKRGGARQRRRSQGRNQNAAMRKDSFCRKPSNLSTLLAGAAKNAVLDGVLPVIFAAIRTHPAPGASSDAGNIAWLAPRRRFFG